MAKRQPKEPIRYNTAQVAIQLEIAQRTVQRLANNAGVGVKIKTGTGDTESFVLMLSDGDIAIIKSRMRPGPGRPRKTKPDNE